MIRVVVSATFILAGAFCLIVAAFLAAGNYRSGFLVLSGAGVIAISAGLALQ